jgi:hypothetical protein
LRLDGASDGTSKRTSEPRPRIGGMLGDADLDGLLRLGGRADPPTHQSGGRYTQSARADGLDISRSVPSRLPLVERPGGIRLVRATTSKGSDDDGEAAPALARGAHRAA